ncbi:MAG: hypothetical protein ABI621_18290 [Chloroflexota bacterium]
MAQLHFSDAISIKEQIAVQEERLQSLRQDLAELERRTANGNMPVPLPTDALQKGVTRAMFSLEYGIRRYQFEVEWTKNILQVLKNA